MLLLFLCCRCSVVVTLLSLLCQLTLFRHCSVKFDFNVNFPATGIWETEDKGLVPAGPRPAAGTSDCVFVFLSLFVFLSFFVSCP